MRTLILIVALSAFVAAKEHSKTSDKKTEKRGLDEVTGDHGAVSYSHVVQSHHSHPHHSHPHHLPVKTVTLTKEVPVPHPYPVAVEKRVPYPVKVPVAVPVHVPKPYPVHVVTPLPYYVEKPVPVPVKIPVREHQQYQPIYIAKLPALYSHGYDQQPLYDYTAYQQSGHH